MLVLAKVDLVEVEEDLNLVIDPILTLQLVTKVDGVITLELLKIILTRIVVGERSSIINLVYFKNRFWFGFFLTFFR